MLIRCIINRHVLLNSISDNGFHDFENGGDQGNRLTITNNCMITLGIYSSYLV